MKGADEGEHRAGVQIPCLLEMRHDQLLGRSVPVHQREQLGLPRFEVEVERVVRSCADRVVVPTTQAENDYLGPGGEPGADLERSEREAALHRAIAELPEDRRIVVVLRDIEGLTYDEIAAALSLELNTVRSRLHRARLDLKEKLERFLP